MVMQESTEDKAEDKIYSFVCNNPGLSANEISKKLRMSNGKIRSVLSKLNKRGLIKFKPKKNNPKMRRLSYPKNFIELLPKCLRNELKKNAKNLR